MPTGRPTKYNAKLAAEICNGLADGESLKSICEAEDMPNRGTVYCWLGKNEEFSNMYARAKSDMCEDFADEILTIADCDDGDYGYKDTGDGSAKPFLLKENIQRDRLRVDTRKWLMSKLIPRKYGDATKITGDSEAPLVLKITKNDTKL